MQLQHHLNLQQQELMQQLQLVQRQYLLHQGFVKPLQIDIQRQNHLYSPTAPLLQKIPTELNEQQQQECLDNIPKPIYHNHQQESHLEQSFQEQQNSLSPFQPINATLQHHKIMHSDHTIEPERLEGSYDSNDEQHNPQMNAAHMQDSDSERYYEANVAIGAPVKSELEKTQQQKLDTAYNNSISHISSNDKDSNSAEHQHQATTSALFNSEQQDKAQFPQQPHPISQAAASSSSAALKVEDSTNEGEDIFDNKGSPNMAYFNFQQKHNLYVAQSKHQAKDDDFHQRIRTVSAQSVSSLPMAQSPPQFSTQTQHSAAVAVAAASISNAAVVAASASGNNLNSFFNFISSLGNSSEACTSGEMRKGAMHHSESFSSKKYYHPLYAHGVCRWPSCEMEIDDVTSFIKHLNTDHCLNDCSTAQARVQMQVVSQLEVHLQKERDRLQAMMHHLYLTKQFLSPEKNELRDPTDATFHSNSSNVGHINTTHISSPNLSSSSITSSIRKRISDKSPLTVTSEIQRNREFYKNADIRPPFTYASLIRQSIIESPDKQLTLNEIYNWFQNTFCYFRRNAATWKNAIRTNLSLHKCFVRYEDDFGSFWMVDDSEFVKRRHLSRGRPRKYEPSLSPNTKAVQYAGSGDEGFSSSFSEQHHDNQRKHYFHDDVDDNHGDRLHSVEASVTKSCQRLTKDFNKKPHNKINNDNNNGTHGNEKIRTNGFKHESSLMSIGEGDGDGVVGVGVDNEFGGYKTTSNYETHKLHHESLSNSPTFGAGSFSTNLKNIWACQPISLEEAAALTINSHYLRQNLNNSYHNTVPGLKPQQHSSIHDRNLMHKHYIHHHHLQQHHQYKKQIPSTQEQLFLPKPDRLCQNFSININPSETIKEVNFKQHEECKREECLEEDERSQRSKQTHLFDIKLSPADMTTTATCKTPTPMNTPNTALDAKSPSPSTATDYITMQHPHSYENEFH